MADIKWIDKSSFYEGSIQFNGKIKDKTIYQIIYKKGIIHNSTISLLLYVTENEKLIEVKKLIEVDYDLIYSCNESKTMAIQIVNKFKSLAKSFERKKIITKLVE